MAVRLSKSEKAVNMLERSAKELRLADHMFYYTLSLTDNQKLFMSCVKHLRDSLIFGAKALLENELYYKQLAYIPSDGKMLIKLFLDKYGDKLNLNEIDKRNLKELNYLYDLGEQRQAGVKKGDSYLVVSADYEMFSLNKSRIRNYLEVLKTLNDKLKEWIG